MPFIRFTPGKATAARPDGGFRNPCPKPDGGFRNPQMLPDAAFRNLFALPAASLGAESK